MKTDTASHSDYLSAFQHFMQTGENEPLTAFLGGARPTGFLNVYRNGYLKASVSGLESNFPALVKLWGEDYFRQVANAYVNQAPPSSATLVGYGFEDPENGTSPSFLEFLQNDVADIVAQYPYVLDVCRLDQAWLQALNENGEGYLTLPVVQELIERGEDLSELPLGLVESSRVVDLEFDILELWSQLRFSSVPDDKSVALQAQSNSVVFWQRDLQVQAKQLTQAEAVFMQSLKRHDSFDAATNNTLALGTEFDVSTLFAELLNAQLLKL